MAGEITKGGATISAQARRLARTVAKHTCAGAMSYGLPLPAAAALTLACQLISAADAAGLFDGQGGAKGEFFNPNLASAQAQLLGMDATAIKEYLTTL